MSSSVHLSTARTMLNSGDPVSIKAWKKDGSVICLENAVSTSFSFYGGWRNIKLLTSGQIRRIRDVCIFEINGMEVFL